MAQLRVTKSLSVAREFSPRVSFAVQTLNLVVFVQPQWAITYINICVCNKYYTHWQQYHCWGA